MRKRANTRTVDVKGAGLALKVDAGGSTRIVKSPLFPVQELHQTIGNLVVQRLFRSRAVQGKLKMGEPNDVCEQEADRVAEQVMRMPEDSAVSGQRSAIGRDVKSTIQLKPG